MVVDYKKELCKKDGKISFPSSNPYIFSEQQIRELRYAALLHDFGKIGVKESVLSKRLKLYPHEMETILLRLDSARAKQEMSVWRDMAHELVELFDKGALKDPKTKLGEVSQKIDQFAQQLQQLRLSIVKANQPQIVEQDFDIGTLMLNASILKQEGFSTFSGPSAGIYVIMEKRGISPQTHCHENSFT